MGTDRQASKNLYSNFQSLTHFQSKSFTSVCSLWLQNFERMFIFEKSMKQRKEKENRRQKEREWMRGRDIIYGRC